MKEATLWTPANPFLYTLTLNTGQDEKTVRFGMRSFRADTKNKTVLLNEEPYYLRGTNVCIFRFFEDPERGTLPWDDQWIVKLHERFKDMHWEIARYCIGFPPERWYEICDSLGFMVQDEFPVWGIYQFTPTQIAHEYQRWMRERWNHPSVVIWDAQNETVTPLIEEAIKQVRGLDLSDRPWENGWSKPAADKDIIESHPYLFNEFMGNPNPAEGYKKYLFGKNRPANGNSAFDRAPEGKETVFPNTSIINEYGWIWLNRNGSTTTLTDNVYEHLWKSSTLTPDERLTIYARNLAMLTEYWRAHRGVAGVLHFCGLGYSRPEAPRGQTSDHWIDLNNLTYEPNFYKYARPAFAPVGLMIDLWEKEYSASTKINVPVYVVNDLKTPFEQTVVLTILNHEGKEVSTSQQAVSAKGYEVPILNFEVTLPEEKGDYTMKAAITVDGEKVFSVRDIPVVK
jgi:hypothetical protein